MHLTINGACILFRAIESLAVVEVAPDVWRLRVRTVSGAEHDQPVENKAMGEGFGERLLELIATAESV